MFTNDPAIVNALRTQFDKFWVDTTYFLDWPAAYKRETGNGKREPANRQTGTRNSDGAVFSAFPASRHPRHRSITMVGYAFA